MSNDKAILIQIESNEDRTQVSVHLASDEPITEEQVAEALAMLITGETTEVEPKDPTETTH